MSKQYYHAETYDTRSSVGYLVKRAHGLALDMLEPELARHGLTFTQYAVLMSVRDGIALNPKDLCIQLRHDSGALTRLLDQLESRGLVERHRSVEDRRAIEVHLTAAGEEALRTVIPLVVNRINSVLKDFSHAEVDELLRLLNKLILGWQGELAAGGQQS
ncbi:MAG TPA: MarR family transcriptional regulator [Nevskia sp.]|jgi:DNA-binding MarR family transcriptional regulator|nr:MarR family transcriptional regulator [Nevskia sp.]